MEENNIFEMLSNGGGWKKWEKNVEVWMGGGGRVGVWMDESNQTEPNRGDGCYYVSECCTQFFFSPFVVTSFCFVLTSNQFIYTYVLYLLCDADDIHGITWATCVIYQEWIWRKLRTAAPMHDSFSLNEKAEGTRYTCTFFVWFFLFDAKHNFYEQSILEEKHRYSIFKITWKSGPRMRWPFAGPILLFHSKKINSTKLEMACFFIAWNV